MNARILDRKTVACIGLILGGVTDDAQVASAAGLQPYRDLSQIDWVRRLRKVLLEAVNLQYPVRCDHHRGLVTTVPCLTCNHPDFLDLKYSFTVDGMNWHRDKFKIELAQKVKREEQRAKVAAARATRKKKVTAKPKGAKRGKD